EVWVTFSGDDHDGKVQIIDLMTMKSSSVIDAGKRIYHLVFTPRGDRAILSSNESNEVVILDAMNYDILKKISVHSPSGIFGIWRAFQIGL
ncbi:MAG: protein nirF, partial [Spirochaetia bacterium]|nr:protein nirF [Spirochaetia bacterium]